MLLPVPESEYPWVMMSLIALLVPCSVRVLVLRKVSQSACYGFASAGQHAQASPSLVSTAAKAASSARYALRAPLVSTLQPLAVACQHVSQGLHQQADLLTSEGL